MGLETMFAQQADMVVPCTGKTKVINSAVGTQSVTLKPYEVNVIIHTTDGAHGNIALYLPPLAEAKGKIYTLRCATYTATVNTVIHCYDANVDEAIGWSDLTFDSDEDYAVLYATGREWTILAGTYT